MAVKIQCRSGQRHHYEPAAHGSLPVMSADFQIRSWTAKNAKCVTAPINSLRITPIKPIPSDNPAGWTFQQMADFIKEKGITCPGCGSSDFTEIKKFNLMFKTFVGVTEEFFFDCLSSSRNRPGYICQFPEYCENYP